MRRERLEFGGDDLNAEGDRSGAREERPQGQIGAQGGAQLRERLERADAPARARMLTDLQRSLGNRQTSRLIQRTPVAPVVGAGEAIGIAGNLAQTASLVGEVYTGTFGGLTYTSSTAQRISDDPQPRTGTYRARCLSLLTEDFDPGFNARADAFFDVEWEGNDHGEIGAARVRANIDETTNFGYSSANVRFDALQNLIQPGGEARTWQMQWDYEGEFDPAGGGQLWFQGTFAIDAFGNFIDLHHTVKEVGGKTVSVRAVPGPNIWKGIPPAPGTQAAPGGAPAAPPPQD